LTFNEQKEFQKLEREIKDLEEQKNLNLNFILRRRSVAENDIEKKGKNCVKLINKIEAKEELFARHGYKYGTYIKNSTIL
jgi:ATP-binding cassette subfamily F protein uup